MNSALRSRIVSLSTHTVVPYKDRSLQLAYQNRWTIWRRREWLLAYGPCVDCGGALDLEVDHDDPERKLLHRVWTYAKAKRDSELEKCVVRCRVCHAKKTARENRERNVWALQIHDHGTPDRLVKGCMCAVCQMARRCRAPSVVYP